MRNAKTTYIKTAFRRIGVAVPATLTDLEDARNKVSEAAKDLKNYETGYSALAGAWAKAILDDRDPFTDGEVIRSLVITALVGGDLEYAAHSAIEARFVDNLRETVPDILAAFKTAADAAGESLTQAYQVLGDIELENTAWIMGMGPVAVQAHHAAREGNTTLRLINNAWDALAEITQFAPTTVATTIRFADLPLDTFEKVRNRRDFWPIIKAGGAIDLATSYETIRARQARHSQEHAARSEKQAARA